MPSAPHTIRFNDEIWKFISAEAGHAQITEAAFIREAALARATFSLAQRDPVAHQRWQQRYIEARGVLEHFNGNDD